MQHANLKRLSYLFLVGFSVLFFSQVAYAQYTTSPWRINLGSGSANAIVKLPNGKFVATGAYFARFDGTNGAILSQKSTSFVTQSLQPNSSGGVTSVIAKPNSTTNFYDYFIGQLDSTGNVVSETPLAKIESAEFRLSSVQLASDGGYLVAGVRINPTTTNSDAWIAKYTASGSIVWEKTLGGSGEDRAYSIKQTPDGGYIMHGYTTSSNSGDITNVNNGKGDYWVVKLSAARTIQWQKLYGGSEEDGGLTTNSGGNSVYAKGALILTSDGGYVLAGTTKSSNTGNVGANNGSDDFWIVKLNASGSIQWQKPLGGAGQEILEDIQQTKEGGYIVVGSTSSNNTGNVGATIGIYDMWMLKLNSTGAVEWQRTEGLLSTFSSAYAVKEIDGGFLIAGSIGARGNPRLPPRILPNFVVLRVNAPCLKTIPTIAGNDVVCRGQTLKLTGSATTGTTRWSSVDSSVAIVSSNGTVTGISAGTVTIGYAVTEGTCTIEVLKDITVKPSPFVYISAPSNTNCNNPTLRGWGFNDVGQLGDGTTNGRYNPTQITTKTDWKEISVGKSHTLAIKTDGSLWAWGGNSFGQLGDGTQTNKSIPTQIGSGKDWKKISGGGDHSLAIKTDGSLWAWGTNGDNQLGDGTTTQRNSPVQIGTAKDWNEISAGIRHSVAIKTDGSLWTWGLNSFGLSPIGATSIITSPKQYGTGKNWKAINASDGFTLAIKTDGSLWGWGANGNGNLGSPESSVPAPTQIGTAKDWKQVSSGATHVAAVKTDGSLWMWGSNLEGELGNGTRAFSNTPTQLGSLKDWKQACAGYFTTFVIKTDGSLWAWGRNFQGELGDGTTIGFDTPRQIGTNKSWKQLCANARNFFTIALNCDNEQGSIALNVGETITLLGPPPAGTSQWSSADNTIVTVSSTGIITGKKAGTTTIRYTATEGGCTSSATRTIIVGGQNPNPNPTIDPTKCYRIVNKATNKALEVKNAAQADGAQIYQWTVANNRPQQIWRFKIPTTDRFNIISKSSGKLVDAPDCGEGAIIKQFAADGTGSQNWKFDLQSDGSYKILNQSCNKYIRVAGSNPADGHEVGIKNDFGTDTFKWLVQEAACPTPNVALVGNETFIFDAQAVEGRALLQWATKASDKIDYFNVERLNAQGDFEILDKQNANTDNAALKSYTFTDVNPLEGDNFYRIQTLSNGNTPPQYSDIKKVNFVKTADVGIYPNPASDFIDLDLRKYEGKKVTLYVYDQVGRLIKSQVIEKASSAPVRLDMGSHGDGQMLLRVSAEGRREVTKKFVIQH
jgi:alpha-tubulin suppressor-like RCC1 family protein